MSPVRDTFNSLERSAYFQWWEDCYKGAPDPGVVQYEIEDDADGGTWQVVIDNERPTCSVRQGPAEGVHLRLRLSATAWRSILAERTSFWSLLSSGRVRADGDRDLLGVLDLLGLLGPPVTAQQVTEHKQDPWVARTPYFVLPRVLWAGVLNHDKWRYFVEQGDLRAKVSHVAWRVWAEGAAARHGNTLRPVLKPVWWRNRLLNALPTTRASWLGAALAGILVPIVTFALLPLWPFMALLTAMFLFVFVVGSSAWSAYHLRDRASGVLTRLACEDPDFFRFAIERKLMQIDRTPWGNK